MNFKSIRTAVMIALLGMLIVGCSRRPVLVVTFNPAHDESGWYPIDVAAWHQDPITNDWYRTTTDALAELQAFVLEPGTDEPNRSRTIILDQYTVRWRFPDISLPRTTGLLNVAIPPAPDNPGPASFTILVLPAVTKDTADVLRNLMGDPSSGSTLNDQLIVRAAVDFAAHDARSGEEFTATLEFTADFADFPNPNVYH